MNRLHKRLITALALMATFFSAFFFSITAIASENPSVIRFGSPIVGTGNRPIAYGSYYATAQTKALFEEEFKKDGIRIEWNNFKGAGPAVNEALANNLLDITWEGDLPALIGKAGGLNTRLLLASGYINGNLVVPTNSQAQTLSDLKGKKISLFKGTATQLIAAKVYESNGLKESDFRTISMDGNTGVAALTTGDVDGLWTGSNAYQLVDRGVGRIILDTRSKSYEQGAQAFVLVHGDFDKKYPHIVQRIINVLVREAAWSSDPKNRTKALQLWAKSGIPYSSLARDVEGQDFKRGQSPLLDPFFINNIKLNVSRAQKLGLLQGDLNVEEWLEPGYLQQALKNEQLEHFWTSYSTDGKPAS
jgi:ABC-type nitrate/sulfonate/bicarbonate transport systems, periplasmic components